LGSESGVGVGDAMVWGVLVVCWWFLRVGDMWDGLGVSQEL